MADEKRIITVNQGTKLEWQNQARTQKTGELGLATDSRELKIGDGLKSFFDLPTLLEVDNAETIKAALEGNATLTGSNVVADMAALEDGLATKQDELAANILAALEGNTSLSGTNVVADKNAMPKIPTRAQRIVQLDMTVSATGYVYVYIPRIDRNRQIASHLPR